jgi:hypothetical protein
MSGDVSRLSDFVGGGTGGASDGTEGRTGGDVTGVIDDTGGDDRHTCPECGAEGERVNGWFASCPTPTDECGTLRFGCGFDR